MCLIVHKLITVRVNFCRLKEIDGFLRESSNNIGLMSQSIRQLFLLLRN